MPEYTDKATLLADINDSHTKFKAQLAPLSEEQLTTPGVNGTWSIKDNIAHLSAWQKVLLARLLAVRDNTHYEEDTIASLDVDTGNEQLYQQNKTRSLSDVLAEFDSIHQQVVQTVESMTDEQINKPQDWLGGQPVLGYITGDTVEHYEEHGQIIQTWLDRTHV
jgi:hypothetical protein